MTSSAVLDGALIVDKPPGPTSHDVVAVVRRTLRVQRVGHTGTLDPLATGILVLLLGKATRLAQFLVADEKEYVADIRLGIETPSYDAATLAEGFRLKAEATESQLPEPRGFRLQPEANDLNAALQRFRGTFLQTPPPYSAKKVGGTPAYEHARRAVPVDLAPVEVTTHAIDFVAVTGDLVRLRIVCSSGFYVRSLAHDLGRALGCGAYLEGLRRTRVGPFGLDRARTLDAIERDAIIPIDSLLDGLPALTLSDEGARRASHGNWLAPQHLAPGTTASTGPRVRLVDAGGQLVAVADRGPDALLHPLVVLV